MVITSSPGATPLTSIERCKPAVHELTALAYPHPMYSRKSSSKRLTFGPVDSQPERSESMTSAISGSSIIGLPNTRNSERTRRYLYRTIHSGAPVSVPLLRLGPESMTVVPVPSLKCHRPTVEVSGTNTGEGVKDVPV